MVTIWSCHVMWNTSSQRMLHIKSTCAVPQMVWMPTFTCIGVFSHCHEAFSTVMKYKKKNNKTSFALNMGNFYLASESPGGENCHMLAVDVLLWRKDSLIEPEVHRVHQHQSKDSHPQGPRRPLLVPQQQVSPQTNALQNDRITRERERARKQKQKMCTGCVVIASLLCIIIFWFTETDAERKGTGRGKDASVFPIISSQLPIIPNSEPDQMAEYRFKYKINHTHHFQFSSGSRRSSWITAQHLRHYKNYK